MRVNANIAAINASRNLGVSNSMLGKSLEKLSSGYRINRAADDAAGLAISEGLRSEIRGTNQAIRNAQDGVSFLQTAEGALNEVHSMLQRMRELAVQASNKPDGEATAEAAEYTALAAEIDSIGTRTTFSGSQVFVDQSTRAFQVGQGATDQLTIALNLELASGTIGADVVDVSALDFATQTGAQDALTTLDDAIDSLSSTRGSLGAIQNRLESTIANLGVTSENLTASESRIRDVDMAAEMVTYTKNNILSQAGTAMLAQANQIPQGILSLLR
jgi:flagellin